MINDNGSTMDNNPTFDVCNHAGDCDYADGDMVEDDWTGTGTGYSRVGTSGVKWMTSLALVISHRRLL